MLVYFIGKNHSDQLRDTSQEQVGMERLFVLGSASGKSKAVFKMINGALHGSPDLIGLLPFGSPAQGTRIGPQVFFGINIDHSPTGRRSAGILTVTDTVIFSGGGVFFPFDFRAAELAACNTASESACTFRLHGEGRVVRAAGDTVRIYGIIFLFQT